MVSFTNYFLMDEFDHCTGLIKFNLPVCLFPNNTFTGSLIFFLRKTANILAIIFFEQSPFSSNFKICAFPW